MSARLAAIAILLAACASAPPRCEHRDFAPQPQGEHIVQSIATPFVVKAFRGRLLLEGDAWPAELPVQFEVHGAAGAKFFVVVQKDGTFEQGLKPGRYCFKISTGYTRSYLGTFVVDPARGEARPMEIAVLLGA